MRNITDIDDKIINRAKELKIGWQDLVKKYIDSYYQDLKALGIEKADFEPRATENIPDMIKAIETLLKKDYAYVTDTGVYFSVRKFKDYGKLSGQSISEMQTGARIEPDETKQDPLDFALWKISKPEEPFWPSPWGAGRPGWHIECSVMSTKYLKTETLDIHAGGRDLIFPHHENEVAQSEALTGKPFAKYWMHHGLLTINGHKMAKSAGNFVTIKDFLAKYKDADLLKLFFLSAHYSHPMDYSEQSIEDAKKQKERFKILFGAINRKLSSMASKPKPAPVKQIEELKDKFFKEMDDDFNTAQGLASLFEMLNITNKNIDNLEFIYSAKITLSALLDIFAIDKKFRDSLEEDSADDADIKVKIKERNKARKESNFILADKIRKELEANNIILEDTKEGTTWRRKI